MSPSRLVMMPTSKYPPIGSGKRGPQFGVPKRLMPVAKTSVMSARKGDGQSSKVRGVGDSMGSSASSTVVGASSPNALGKAKLETASEVLEDLADEGPYREV